jgi:hypothetical protein
MRVYERIILTLPYSLPNGADLLKSTSRHEEPLIDVVGKATIKEQTATSGILTVSGLMAGEDPDFKKEVA